MAAVRRRHQAAQHLSDVLSPSPLSLREPSAVLNLALYIPVLTTRRETKRARNEDRERAKSTVGLHWARVLQGTGQGEVVSRVYKRHKQRPNETKGNRHEGGPTRVNLGAACPR